MALHYLLYNSYLYYVQNVVTYLICMEYGAQFSLSTIIKRKGAKRIKISLKVEPDTNSKPTKIGPASNRCLFLPQRRIVRPIKKLMVDPSDIYLIPGEINFHYEKIIKLIKYNLRTDNNEK